ncbi:sterol desaturase family protein [Flocculibacter collagenilyticus]|uniref:sterol desaturase family protein n=1 Tax=Flocculibacter collagenilyticus TaxID=2744479 RepID=UPI0018F432AE
MPIEAILLALSPIFFACIIIEYKKLPKNYNVIDSINNVLLAAMHQFADAIAVLLVLPIFAWIYQYRLLNIELTVFTVVMGFVFQDFLYYWFHRCSHKINWLWSAHIVHHSSTIMNFSTAFRQSFIYPMVGMWMFWLPLALLGYPPTLIFMIVALNLGYQFFVHTELAANTETRTWFNFVFNTPSHHRVHHAINPEYIDKNFGGVLIIWDRLFGTFSAEKLSNPCKYGIAGKEEQQAVRTQMSKINPITITLYYWKHMFKLMKHEHTLAKKLKILGMSPAKMRMIYIDRNNKEAIIYQHFNT